MNKLSTIAAVITLFAFLSYADEKLDLAKSAVVAAQESAKKAEAEAAERFEKSDAGATILDDLKNKEAAIKSARAGTDSQLKLDASSAYNKAKSAAEKARVAFVEKDKAVIDSRAAIKAAKDSESAEEERVASAKPELSESEWTLANLILQHNLKANTKGIPDTTAFYAGAIGRPKLGRAVSIKGEQAADDPRLFLVSAHVIQVQGKDEMLIAMGPQDLWISGLSTEGIADGNNIPMRDCILVCQGTKTYTTVEGASRTIYSVKYYPLTDEVKKGVAFLERSPAFKH